MSKKRVQYIQMNFRCTYCNQQTQSLDVNGKVTLNDGWIDSVIVNKYQSNISGNTFCAVCGRLIGSYSIGKNNEIK